MRRMVRVLVMGASGFLGGQVYKRLQRAEDSVRVSGTCSGASPAEGLIPVELTSDRQVRFLLRDMKPDVVIWCVKARQGQDEIPLVRGGLSVLVDEAGLSSRIIFVSTDAALPGIAGRYGESTPLAASAGQAALDHYINAKIEAERMIVARSSDFCIVRSGPIFGRGLDGRWDRRTQEILDALGCGERVERSLNLIRTFVHVQDLAESLCELSRARVNGVLHVGSPCPASYWDFAIAVAHRAGFPTHAVRGTKISPGDAARRQIRLDTSMDTSRAAACLRTRFRNVPEALEGESLEDLPRNHS